MAAIFTIVLFFCLDSFCGLACLLRYRVPILLLGNVFKAFQIKFQKRSLGTHAAFFPDLEAELKTFFFY